MLKKRTNWQKLPKITKSTESLLASVFNTLQRFTKDTKEYKKVERRGFEALSTSRQYHPGMLCISVISIYTAILQFQINHNTITFSVHFAQHFQGFYGGII